MLSLVIQHHIKFSNATIIWKLPGEAELYSIILHIFFIIPVATFTRLLITRMSIDCTVREVKTMG